MNRSTMPHFLSYLLGAWLLLSLMPNETSPHSTARFHLICENPLVSVVEQLCSLSAGRATHVEKELFLMQQTQLSDTIDFSSYKDLEALNIFSEYIPDFPHELKVTISDRQSFLRKIQQPKERGGLIDFFSALMAVCCSDNCITKMKDLLCNKNPEDNTDIVAHGY
ncbi:prorelaxin-like [Perognathus longimembris pacificus]|uniref:prorelaxin-like n=1 Tax=Perognathus longimembris pacificus TaxID=214514 RepID=UPI002018FAC1|nr:prorelaxin-like [Perognathus longimembris pacificus]